MTFPTREETAVSGVAVARLMGEACRVIGVGKKSARVWECRFVWGDKGIAFMPVPLSPQSPEFMDTWRAIAEHLQVPQAVREEERRLQYQRGAELTQAAVTTLAGTWQEKRFFAVSLAAVISQLPKRIY